MIPEAPVFASSSGKPVDAHNIFNRILKPIGAKLGMPWLGWHVFRHTHASWVRQEAMAPADQMAMLGHTDMRMTMQYGEEDLERRRKVIERIGELLDGKPTKVPGGVN
jgi:integrase